MDKLSNHNKKWNNIDIKNIIIDINNNISFDELESKYQRTNGAIKSKLLQIPIIFSIFSV
jgi:hypothetical protein